MLLPCMHQHDAGRDFALVIGAGDLLQVAIFAQHAGGMGLRVIRPDAPYRQGRRIVLCLLSVCRVQRGDDVIKRRILRFLPQLPVLPLNDTAILWGW